MVKKSSDDKFSRYENTGMWWTSSYPVLVFTVLLLSMDGHFFTHFSHYAYALCGKNRQTDNARSYERYLWVAGQAWHVQHPWPVAVIRRQLGHVPVGRVPSWLTQAVLALDLVQSAVSQGVSWMHSVGSLLRDLQPTPSRFPSATHRATAPVQRLDETECPAQTLAYESAVPAGATMHVTHTTTTTSSAKQNILTDALSTFTTQKKLRPLLDAATSLQIQLTNKHILPHHTIFCKWVDFCRIWTTMYRGNPRTSLPWWHRGISHCTAACLACTTANLFPKFYDDNCNWFLILFLTKSETNAADVTSYCRGKIDKKLCSRTIYANLAN